MDLKGVCLLMGADQCPDLDVVVRVSAHEWRVGICRRGPRSEGRWELEPRRIGWVDRSARCGLGIQVGIDARDGCEGEGEIASSFPLIRIEGRPVLRKGIDAVWQRLVAVVERPCPGIGKRADQLRVGCTVGEVARIEGGRVDRVYRVRPALKIPRSRNVQPLDL